MTVVTKDVSAEPADGLDNQLVRRLAARARAEGLRLTGEGGLLARLTKVALKGPNLNPALVRYIRKHAAQE